MTIASSGELTFDDINTERSKTAGTSFSLGDDAIRLLADQPTGAVSMSDFYSRLPYRVLETRDEAAGGATHTFTGVDFGNHFTGRVLMAVTGVYHSNGGLVLNQTSATIGGTAAVGDDAGFGDLTHGSIGAGQWLVDDTVTATSGNVAFTTSTAGQRVALIMIAMDIIDITATSSTTGQHVGNGTATASSNVTALADGFIINVLAKTGTNTTSFNNVTKREELEFNSANILAIGIDNKTSSGTVSLSCSWTGNSAGGAEGRTYNEA